MREKARTIARSTALFSLLMEERITIDSHACHGKPCARGLRYPVEAVLEWLAAGMSVKEIKEILADYEDLEREDIYAVLRYAA